MTKTKTLTEAECHALAVRGDVPGVLDGYVGLVIWGVRTERIALGCEHEGRVLVVDDGVGDMTHWAPSLDLRLPVANPLVQAHIVGWLGRGARCAPCDGLGRRAAGTLASCECSPCKGTGYLRPRFNCYSWLTPEAHEGLPDWIRMALIWGSVVRVAAGMNPLRGVDVRWDADMRTSRDGLALIDDAPTGPVIRFEVPE